MDPLYEEVSFQWIYWVIGFFVLVLILWMLVRKIAKFFNKPELYGMSRAEIKTHWNDIEALLRRNDEMSYKLAVMEADKILDYALKSLGFGGKTLGERLKLVAYKFPKVKNVWPAHIMRNQLVHEASFHITRGSAERAIYQFKAALKELGVLE